VISLSSTSPHSQCADTWCVPHGESFQRVWSWYNHPLPSYSVIAADRLRDLVTLIFDLLTLVRGRVWQVTWSIHPPSLKILSVLESWVLPSPIGYHWQCVCSHCACAVSRDLCIGGKFFSHIWNPWPRFAYSVYNFYGPTITFKGRSLSAPLMLKLFFGR